MVIFGVSVITKSYKILGLTIYDRKTDEIIKKLKLANNYELARICPVFGDENLLIISWTKYEGPNRLAGSILYNIKTDEQQHINLVDTR